MGILLKDVELVYSLSWKSMLEERDLCIQIDSWYFHTRWNCHIFMGNEFAYFSPWNKPCDRTIWSELRLDTPHWVSQNTGLAVIWLIGTPELEKNSGSWTQSACVNVFLFLVFDYLFVIFDADNCWSSASVWQFVALSYLVGFDIFPVAFSTFIHLVSFKSPLSPPFPLRHRISKASWTLKGSIA